MIQEKPKLYKIISIQETEESNKGVEEWIKDNFKHLCIRIGKSKYHVMRTKFSKDATPIQQKGRRNPINLQERVEKELNKLMIQTT